MKYAEINKKFTDTVAEWLAKGWRINTASMNGSQGETAKVDFTDGKEIVRVMLCDLEGEFCETVGDRWYSFEGLRIVVGRVTDNTTPDEYDRWHTVWNGNLEIISEEKFYEIGRNRGSRKWYGTREEAMAQQDKALDRRRERKVNDYKFMDAAAIVLPFVKRQPKCKSLKVTDIEFVRKDIDHAGRATYTVKTNRGNSYRLH